MKRLALYFGSKDGWTLTMPKGNEAMILRVKVSNYIAHVDILSPSGRHLSGRK